MLSILNEQKDNSTPSSEDKSNYVVTNYVYIAQLKFSIITQSRLIGESSVLPKLLDTRIVSD